MAQKVEAKQLQDFNEERFQTFVLDQSSIPGLISGCFVTTESPFQSIARMVL